MDKVVVCKCAKPISRKWREHRPGCSRVRVHLGGVTYDLALPDKRQGSRFDILQLALLVSTNYQGPKLRAEWERLRLDFAAVFGQAQVPRSWQRGGEMGRAFQAQMMKWRALSLPMDRKFWCSHVVASATTTNQRRPAAAKPRARKRRRLMIDEEASTPRILLAIKSESESDDDYDREEEEDLRKSGKKRKDQEEAEEEEEEDEEEDDDEDNQRSENSDDEDEDDDEDDEDDDASGVTPMEEFRREMEEMARQAKAHYAGRLRRMREQARNVSWSSRHVAARLRAASSIRDA